MATDANMDWSQSAPTGYVSAFRSGNVNQYGNSHDPNNAYMIRGEVPVHESRSQYGSAADYNPHNAHVASAVHSSLHAPASSIGEHFWQQQNQSTQNDALPDDPVAAPDELVHTEPANEAEITPPADEAPGVPSRRRKRGPRTSVPRSERRKHYKPKPDPSHPRLFRPFQPLEMSDTTPTQWTMPPIVGSWLMFSNKMVKYRPMPPDVDEVREKLFKMKESILLKNSQEVADYVPHINNIWRRAVQRVEIDERTGLQTEYWHCRTKKAMKPRKDDGTKKGIRNRDRKSQLLFHDKDICTMRIRVISYTKHADRNPFHLRVHGTRAANGHVGMGTSDEHQRWGGGPCKCVAEWVHFELANVDPEVTEHTHDLDIMDGYKNSEALGVLAKNKCEEGNSFAATAKWIQKTFGETSKQVHKIDNIDVANAAQLWRNDNKDLVLREEVPEDSEEMITMRKCVDAILEADARSLRAALREVIKDSDALTKAALSILEKHRPAVPTSEESEEPWSLTEGVTVMDLPPPGASDKLKELTGVYGPPRTPYSPVQHASQTFRLGQGQPIPTTFGANVLGPDGRPIVTPAAPPPAPMALPQANPHPGQPQQQMYQQHYGPPPTNVQQAGGAPLQPRPPMLPYGGPHVDPRYTQAPPVPAPPAQRGSAHPITVSMEVPSCPLDTCQQCRTMRRGLAGRTFFFQDRLHTPMHFTKLQDLLRDPTRLLDDQYTRVLQESQVETVHPHPALHGAVSHGPLPDPRSFDVFHLQRTPASAIHVSNRPRRPPPPKPSQQGPQASRRPPSRPAEPVMGTGSPTSTGGNAVPAPPQPAPVSIYDQPLPVPVIINDDDSNTGHDAAEAANANTINADKDVGGNTAGKDHNVTDHQADDSQEPNGNAEVDNQAATGERSNAEDEDEDEEDAEQRPAKRRRQGSVEQD